MCTEHLNSIHQFFPKKCSELLIEYQFKYIFKIPESVLQFISNGGMNYKTAVIFNYFHKKEMTTGYALERPKG